MKMHKSITTDRVIEAVDADEMTGFCVACGYEQDGCEPDMRDGLCENCGEDKVYGAEELLLYLA